MEQGESGPLPWGAPPPLAVGAQIECELEVADGELEWLDAEVQEVHGSSEYTAALRLELDPRAGYAAAGILPASEVAAMGDYEQRVPVRLRILSDSREWLGGQGSSGRGDGVRRRCAPQPDPALCSCPSLSVLQCLRCGTATAAARPTSAAGACRPPLWKR